MDQPPSFCFEQQALWIYRNNSGTRTINFSELRNKRSYKRTVICVEVRHKLAFVLDPADFFQKPL